ncbi:hypothetical protein J2X65_003505 [Ancylobacter sp. 3268]|uniref:hypothetical protein n=1 Tax=Ancylobacter sp. 3268 TaxID=2817752 RepID=UPI002865B018|nr:hypothetical protein [Ancylobacter sp. 3268]MDR6954137.1 hypothetical protein [Ancylobacter sp. 3268]
MLHRLSAFQRQSDDVALAVQCTFPRRSWHKWRPLMTKFTILTGAAIGKAIAGFGKAIETFKAREHQLAFSALNHVDMHNDPKYLNALYAATPANYRGGLRLWATHFGAVKFDEKAESGPFVYAKGKTADMEGAMNTAPADFVKSQKGDAADKAFDMVVELERLLKRAGDKGAGLRELNAVKLAISSLKGAEIVSAKPAPIVKKAKPAAVAEVQAAA